jgi:hypothetical protein
MLINPLHFTIITPTSVPQQIFTRCDDRLAATDLQFERDMMTTIGQSHRPLHELQLDQCTDPTS